MGSKPRLYQSFKTSPGRFSSLFQSRSHLRCSFRPTGSPLRSIKNFKMTAHRSAGPYGHFFNFSFTHFHPNKKSPIPPPRGEADKPRGHLPSRCHRPSFLYLNKYNQNIHEKKEATGKAMFHMKKFSYERIAKEWKKEYHQNR